MYWSQTESSKCSPKSMFNHLAHPFILTMAVSQLTTCSQPGMEGVHVALGHILAWCHPYWPRGVDASAAVDGGSCTTASVVCVAAPCTGGGSAIAGAEESNARCASTWVNDKPPPGTGRALQTAAVVERATPVVVG